MRPQVILISFLGLILNGCALDEWGRADVTAEQSDRQQIECQRWARREASLRAEGFYGPGHYPYGPFGYHRFGPGATMDPWGYRTLDEAQLADYCMRANGFERLPKKN
jgi:hypothetical protein